MGGNHDVVDIQTRRRDWDVQTQTHAPLSDQQIKATVEHEISEEDVNPRHQPSL
jgi:hypothetical protein